MSDVHMAQPVNEGTDDGLSAEDRAQWAAMEEATSGPVGDAGGEPAGGADAGAAPGGGAGADAGTGGVGGEPAAKAGAVDPAAVARTAAQDAIDDDDEDEGAGGQRAGDGQNGQQAQPKRRVSARKYERLEQQFKELQTKMSSEGEQRARLDERLAILNEALTPKPKPAAQKAAEEDPEPDPEKDIFAHNAWLRRQQQNLAKEVAEMRAGRQQETASNDLANAYIEDARNFAAQEPNFVPAYQHLLESRKAELAMFFFGKDLSDGQTQLTTQELQRVRSEIAGEEKALVQEALNNRQSPAQRVFMMAKARGYRPQAAAAAGAGADGNAAPAGGAKAAAAAPGALNGGAPAGGTQGNVGDEVDRIRAGQEASRSLSNGGGAPPRQFTAESLLKMPDDQFAKLVEQMTPEDEQRFFGG